MPSKSPAQHRLMEAVAHNPAFAKKVGIPQSVGNEYVRADDGSHPSLTTPGGIVERGGYLKKAHGIG